MSPIYDIDSLERQAREALEACIVAKALPPVRVTLTGHPLGLDGRYGRRLMLPQRDIIPARVWPRPPAHEPVLLAGPVDVPLTSLYPLADRYRLNSYVGTRATRLAFLEWGFDEGAVNWASDYTAMIFFDAAYRWESAT